MAISTSKGHKNPVGFYPTKVKGVNILPAIGHMGLGGSIVVEGKRDDWVVKYECCCLTDNDLNNIDNFIQN